MEHIGIEFGHRKVQQVGTSFYIGLPKSWIVYNRVHVGQEIKATLAHDGKALVFSITDDANHGQAPQEKLLEVMPDASPEIQEGK